MGGENNNGGFWKMLAGNLVGPLAGMAMTGWNDRRQLRQQEALMQQQIAGQKELTKFNQEMSYDMWLKTNYGPQVEQMKKAGLNPALMYGMGGGGGQSTNVTPGNVTGGNAPVGGGEVMSGMGMTSQLGLIEAQRKVLESQARLNNTEADKKEGVDTELGKTQIANLTQGIQNAKAEEELKKVQVRIADLDEKLKGETFEYAINTIKWQSDKLYSELEKIQRENQISAETYDEQIKIVKAELVGIYLRNSLTQAQTGKTKSDIQVNNAQIQKMSADIAQKWKELNLTESRNEYEHSDRVKAIEEYTENALKVAGIMAAGHIISDVTGIVTRKVPKGMKSTSTGPKGTTETITEYR